MKKLILLLISVNLTLIFMFVVETKADNSDYESFPEIILSTGKLIAYYTDEEILNIVKQYPEASKESHIIHYENKNVSGTYISNTIFSAENTGATDLNYDFDVVVVTSSKTSYKMSSTIQALGNNTVKKLKTELSIKASQESHYETEESKKETQKMKIIVEPKSRCIVYLRGNLSISNGVIILYRIVLTDYGTFEMAKIQNQYTRIEKKNIE